MNSIVDNCRHTCSHLHPWFFQRSEPSHFITISVESRTCAIASLPSGNAKMAASYTAATRNKTSKVWEHFSLDTANKRITCKVCKADLAYHGSTSVMHEHFKRKHVGQLNESDSL